MDEGEQDKGKEEQKENECMGEEGLSSAKRRKTTYVSLTLCRGRVLARCESLPPAASIVAQSIWQPCSGRAPLDHFAVESRVRLKSLSALRRSRSYWVAISKAAAITDGRGFSVWSTLGGWEKMLSKGGNSRAISPDPAEEEDLL